MMGRQTARQVLRNRGCRNKTGIVTHMTHHYWQKGDNEGWLIIGVAGKERESLNVRYLQAGK